ncbi:hypothetical protein INT43_008835 [Umbelopsis isabellina]|uniref:Alpha-and gamma-adaptin-binding protein p34 n=1 Tax=Mortierella isabellina TaxID=91625 RepID=A0A8H7UGW6_MORIS|nr:hypothetical protein INT43_008835 [Umbelopsis isabellina]
MIPWDIDTKYYTASVDFWLDHIESDAAEAVKAFTDDEAGISEVVDAVILVFRKDEPESFNDIKIWSSFVEKCDLSIRVVLGTCGDLPADYVDTVDEWCSENLFVYVDADEKMDNSEENPMDKTGIPLLLETLEANMWDGLILKSSQAQSSNTGRGYIRCHYDCIQVAHCVLIHYYTDLPSEADIQNMRKQLFGALDDPNDGLDQAFAQIQSLRDMGTTLPDSERRKLAAQVALSFAAQFNDTDKDIND